MREVDQLQRTLTLANAPLVAERVGKIEEEMRELAVLIFPDDERVARELVKEEFQCRTQ